VTSYTSGKEVEVGFPAAKGRLRKQMDDWPRVLRSKRTRVSSWLEVIDREVQFSPEREVENYFAIGQPHYLVALAVTPEGRILLVRQYRPAIECFSLELPAGLHEEGEDPDGREAFTRGDAK
jgi:hypothetical protein